MGRGESGRKKAPPRRAALVVLAGLVLLALVLGLPEGHGGTAPVYLEQIQTLARQLCGMEPEEGTDAVRKDRPVMAGPSEPLYLTKRGCTACAWEKHDS